MPKLIIDYPENMAPELALLLVGKVVEDGRISEARGHKQFCFATQFRTPKVMVCARNRRHEKAADSFLIYEDKDD